MVVTLKQGEREDYDSHPRRVPPCSSFGPLLLLSTLTHLVTLPNLLTLRTLCTEDPQMYKFSGNPGCSSRLAFPTAYLTPPFECLIVISSLSLVLVSDITSKCQNLFPLQPSLSQNMATLMFQLFRLKTLEISLTPLFLSHPAANLPPVNKQLYLFSVLDYAKQHCYGYSFFFLINFLF